LLTSTKPSIIVFAMKMQSKAVCMHEKRLAVGGLIKADKEV